MIFGVLNPEKISHQQLVHLPTLHAYCNHFTLGNPEKVIFQQYYSYILQIIFVISEKPTCYNCCTAAYLFTHCCLLLPIICIAIFYGQFLNSLVSHFQSHQCQTTTGSFQSHQQMLEERNITFSQM